jgi:hypothetical protein
MGGLHRLQVKVVDVIFTGLRPSRVLILIKKDVSITWTITRLKTRDFIIRFVAYGDYGG